MLRGYVRHGGREFPCFEVVHAGVDAGVRIEVRLPGRHCRREHNHAGIVTARVCPQGGGYVVNVYDRVSRRTVVNDEKGIRLNLRLLVKKGHARRSSVNQCQCVLPMRLAGLSRVSQNGSVVLEQTCMKGN